MVRVPVTVGAVAVALALAGGLIIATGAQSATADAPEIVVSIDGIHYARTLPVGLFDDIGTLVPGDSVTRTLWVENTSPQDAELWLSRQESTATLGLFARALSLYESGKTPSVGGSSDAGDGTCLPIAPARPLASGQSVAIPLTLTVADLDGLDGQNQRVSFSLFATLSDPNATRPGVDLCSAAASPIEVPPPSAPAARPGSSAPLAFTGGAIAAGSVIVGGVLLGLGLFVLTVRRRRTP